VIDVINRISPKKVLAALILTALILAGGVAKANPFTAYTADLLPQPSGWTIVNYPAYEPGHVYLDPAGILHMKDLSSAGGSAAHYFKDFAISPGASMVFAEWDLKAVYASGLYGSYFALESDVPGTYVDFQFTPSGINSPATGGSATTVTTDTFHTYRAELEGAAFRIYQDGGLLYSGTANASGASLGDEVRIHFGLGSSTAQAEFYLDEIRYGFTAPVPEPAPLALLMLSLLGLAIGRRRRR
jgi:hypothetical protein